MFRAFKLVCLGYLSIILVGCATYGQDVHKGLELTQQGQYKEAASVFEKSLDPKGNDRLLYYTELGMVYHLAGDYEKSNRLLETAERISEELYTQKVSDIIATAMSNPRQGPYRAANFERVFINYYKALNYLMLSHGQTNANDKERALEGARVESRRIDMVLRDIETQKGNYQEQADKEKSMFSTLMRIFDKLAGGVIDRNKIVYRNDAFGHYLAGMIYEQYREYDDARVAYQKSASLYENGYQEQYGLKQDITEQAWFDTIRMMQKAGGWRNEWPKLSRTKLSKAKREELKDFSKMGHLVVLEHTGMVPERDEMNMYLTADPNTRQIVIHPVLTGDPSRQLDQRFWFYALYADKGITDLISAVYEKRVIPALMQYSMVKREYLGPLWGVADNVGLIETLQQGMRITVPYYRVTSYVGVGDSWLTIEDNEYALVTGQSVAHMAVQQQLLDAPTDIQEAMSRAAFKNLTANQVASAGGDVAAVLGFLGKIAANASSAAETRNWLLLPDQIKVRRIPLKAGMHDITLTSEPRLGQKKTVTKQVEIKPGEMTVWKVRTFPAKSTHLSKQLGI